MPHHASWTHLSLLLQSSGDMVTNDMLVADNAQCATRNEQARKPTCLPFVFCVNPDMDRDLGIAFLMAKKKPALKCLPMLDSEICALVHVRSAHP